MQRDFVFQALSSDSPCGGDLEYDADFMALQQSMVVKGEQQFGTTIIPAEQPAWNQVERLALALLERTCDLRIIAWLTLAWTRQWGVVGYARGVHAVVQVLESAWTDVHPQLISDGDEDPMPRMNALEALGDAAGAGAALRGSTLLRNAFGNLSVRETETLLDGGAVDQHAYPGGRSRVVDDLRQAWIGHVPELTAVEAASEGLERIRAITSGHLGESWAPQFSGVRKTLATLCQAMNIQSPQAALETGTQAAEGAPASMPVSATRQPGAELWRDAALDHRSDAMAMLEKVCAYFETHEPSHPAPFLLRRVQRLAGANFQELVRELAPGGMAEFQNLAGRQAQDVS